MTSWSRVVGLPAAAIATVALTGCGGDKGTQGTFAGTWQAHARTLKVTPVGDGREWLSLGLDQLAMDVRFS